METATSLRPRLGASQSPEILASVKISDAWRALGGPKLRRCGAEKYRGAGWWRGGDGPDSISLNDLRGVWHDFVTGRGGGILDLIVEARGGSRADALRWLADLAGIPLQDRQLLPAERRAWARERQDLERELPAARYWRRAAVCLADEALTNLKAALFDPSQPAPGVNEIADGERLLRSLRRTDGAELVAEYRWWATHHPRLTDSMVRAARLREAAECDAITTYLSSMAQEASA